MRFLKDVWADDKVSAVGFVVCAVLDIAAILLLIKAVTEAM